MAEPYRVLVVADFPANFSEAAAQRLKSIVASGARCGVFTLLSVDTKLPLPRDFHLADLEADALMLAWSDGQFRLASIRDYGPLPSQLDAPPPAERVHRDRPRRGAPRSRTPAASRCPSSASCPPSPSGGPPTAAAASTCPWAAPGP